MEVIDAGLVPELCSPFNDIDPSLGISNCSAISSAAPDPKTGPEKFSTTPITS